MFIVFEGLDGSGKSTQVRSLFRRLRQDGHNVLLTREPGGTPLGETLRRWLKRGRHLALLSELSLFIAARAQLVEDVIRPALESGVSVIGDRYTASTVAYQGHGRGLDLELLDRLNRAATGGLTPDLTVLLDLPVQAGLARKRNPDADTFDAAPSAFHRKVRDGYLALAAQDPGGWLVLDGTRPRRELSRQIWAKVQPLLWGRGRCL